MILMHSAFLRWKCAIRCSPSECCAMHTRGGLPVWLGAWGVLGNFKGLIWFSQYQ